VKRHLVVMIHHRLFPNPVQRRHRENLAKINGRRIPVSQREITSPIRGCET
jgi:hypothetical protein